MAECLVRGCDADAIEGGDFCWDCFFSERRMIAPRGADPVLQHYALHELMQQAENLLRAAVANPDRAGQAIEDCRRIRAEIDWRVANSVWVTA